MDTHNSKLQPSIICIPQLQPWCSAALIPKFTTLHDVMGLESTIESRDLVHHFGLEPRMTTHHVRKAYTPWHSYAVSGSELSTGRMDPRVGSGRVGSRFCWILAGRVGSALRIIRFFTEYFLVPESIWNFEYCIRFDCFSTIFNI